MDVIDIDTEHGTSDLLFNNSALGMTNLSRSISQLSSASYHPPAAIAQPALFPASYTASSAHPFHFQPSDLEDSTFYVPPTSLQYQQTGNSLVLPSLDRGLSILSQQSVTPAPVAASNDADGYGDGSYVPAPFAPMRDMTGNLSLPPFDEQQQQPQQQSHTYGIGSAPTGSVNGGLMSESAAYDAHQLYQQLASPTMQQHQQMAMAAQPQRHMQQHVQLQQMQMHLKQSQQQHMQNQQQHIPTQNAAFPAPQQLDSFNQPRLAPTPATTISSDYDPSRKRQRGDLPLAAGDAPVPYYMDGVHNINGNGAGNGFYGNGAGSTHLPQSSPQLAVSMSAPSSARAASTPQARPAVMIPGATLSASNSSSASPTAVRSMSSAASVASQSSNVASPPAMPPVVPSRGQTAPANRTFNQSQPVVDTPIVDASSDDYDNASVRPDRDSPPNGSASSDAGGDGEGGEDKEQQKKVKHQMTDRQRRAKIKESMDQLKALVPLEANQKADQATIVAESVDMIKNMKDEIASLRAKLAAMELTGGSKDGVASQTTPSSPMELSAAQRKALLQQSYASSSPLSAMLASLNGAGVSLLRLGLDGRVLEVNLVWEMVTGFSGADVVGRSPCSAPLYGSLSVMPKSFLRYFSTVSAAVSTPMLDGSVSPVSSNSSVGSPMLDGRGPASPASSTSSSGSDDGLPPLPPSGVNTGRLASAASPLFSNVTISSLPIVPHSELQSFYPFKCKTLPDTLSTTSTAPTPSTAAANAANAPLPHGQYLMNHLANLPPNHVLKLLSRVSTSYGDTLESIQTMCLVRNGTGAPDYVLCLTTPDGRRLVKPTKFLGGFGVTGGASLGAGVGLGDSVRATA